MIKFKTFIRESVELKMPELFDAFNTKYTSPLDSVHFSVSKQVSFNPKPFHFDPIGVYGFPREYILEKKEKNQGFFDMPYSHILQPTKKAKILDLNMSEKKATSLLNQMGIPVEYFTNEDGKTYHNSGDVKYNIGQRFWGSMERFRKEKDLSKNASWNTLFKKTGYNVLWDSGNAIIHSNEPNQIVYLEPGTFKVVETFTLNSSKALIRSFIEAFPDWKRRKGKSYGYPTLSLIKSNKPKKDIEILLRFSAYGNVTVDVYGFKERFQKSYDEYKTIVDDVKKFIENGEEKDPWESQEDEAEEIVKEYAKAFGFREPKDGIPSIVRKTIDKTENLPIQIVVAFFNGNMTVRMEGRKQWFWKNYYYYSEDIPLDKNYKEATRKAFDSIQEKIDKDLEGSDWEREEKAKLANKHLKYYKRNVFKL